MLAEMSLEERETVLGHLDDLNRAISQAITAFTEATSLGVYGASITPERNADGSVGYSMSIKIDHLPDRVEGVSHGSL